MKTFKFVALLSLILVQACEFDESLFGNNPKTREHAVSYRSCEEKIMKNYPEAPSKCTPVSSLANLSHIVEQGDSSHVKLSFDRLPDGSFTELKKLIYRSRYGFKKRELECEKQEFPNQWEYICVLKGQGTELNEPFLPAEISVASTKCDIPALFQAQFVNPESCDSWHDQQYSVYINGNKLPYLWALETPAEPEATDPTP